jgi:hypothetical protein
MATGHGKNLAFWLDTQAGVLKDLSAYTMEVTGLVGEIELGDVTTAGSVGHKFMGGLQKASFSAKMLMNDATDASWDVCKSFQSDTATRSFEYYPRGKTSTYPKITGECWIKSVDMPAKVTDPLVMTINFEADGAVTIGTAS